MSSIATIWDKGHLPVNAAVCGWVTLLGTNKTNETKRNDLKHYSNPTLKLYTFAELYYISFFIFTKRISFHNVIERMHCSIIGGKWWNRGTSQFVHLEPVGSLLVPVKY